MRSVQVSTRSARSSRCMSEQSFRLETERLILRRFRAEDGDALARILTDPEVCYFEPYEVMTQTQAVEEAARLADNAEFYAITDKSSGELIGKLYLGDQKFFGAYEIGYAIRRDRWGNGYAAEAARALMQYAFTEMGIRRITAEADIRNTRSCRLLEKLGMRREAVFVQSASFQKDESGLPIWSDYCSYAILQDEFLK